jgi:hypothetical protein
MSELETRQVVIDHRTGEEVSPHDLERVADILDDARTLRYRLSKIIDAAQDALLQEMDAQALWTLRIPGFKVSGDSPEAADVDWDMDVLRELEEHLPHDRYLDCVQTTVTEKPVTSELRRVAKAGGTISDIICRAERRKPKRRRVSISRRTA